MQIEAVEREAVVYAATLWRSMEWFDATADQPGSPPNDNPERNFEIVEVEDPVDPAFHAEQRWVTDWVLDRARGSDGADEDAIRMRNFVLGMSGGVQYLVAILGHEIRRLDPQSDVYGLLMSAAKKMRDD